MDFVTLRAGDKAYHWRPSEPYVRFSVTRDGTLLAHDLASGRNDVAALYAYEYSPDEGEQLAARLNAEVTGKRAAKANRRRRASRPNGRKQHASLSIQSDEWPTPPPGAGRVSGAGNFGIYGIDYYDGGPVRVNVDNNRGLLLRHMESVGIANPDAFLAMVEARLRGIRNRDIPAFSIPSRYLEIPWEYRGTRGLLLLNKK